MAEALASGPAALLRTQNTRLTDIFRDFYDFRVVWDSLVNRRRPVQLQPELHRYAEGIDIQSPDLEWAITQHVNILMLNGTKIDCVSLDQSDKARGDVDDIRIWLGSNWLSVNKNRRLDKANARSLVKYGVAINRLFWTEDEEEAEEDGEEKHREENRSPFRVEHIHPLECKWWPLKDPEIFIQESVMKVVEARELQNNKGQFLSLDAANKFHFVGEREPISTWNAFANRITSVHVITRAEKSKESGQWEISEFVYPEGKDGKVNYEGGEELDSCVCPLNRCPYFIIPGAAEDQFTQDPHLRYRPMMYRLYVYMQDYNYWRTVLSAMARKYSGDNVVYVDLSTVKPEHASILEQVFPVEGSGASRRLTFQLPEPGSGELTVSPGTIERWPAEIEAHALAMFEEVKRLIADAMPNRFMTGEAFGEVRDGTGTAVINMTEQARIPYSAELSMIDGGIKDLLRAFCDCIIWFDEDAEMEQQWPVVVSGSEPLMRPAGKPGREVYVTKTKLERPFEINVQTRNLTQAEESQEALMAYQDFAQNVITKDQLLAIRGHDDPLKQKEDLERERYQKMQEPHTDQMILQTMSVLMTAFTGVNQAALQGLQLPQAPQPQQPQGQPFELTPARNPGQLPQWKPGSMASQMPPTQSGGNTAPFVSAASRPAISPAPIQGPTGGSNPMR